MTSWFDSSSTAVEPLTRPLGPFSGSLTGPVFKPLVSSSLRNLTNEPEHYKARLDSPCL